ncbi:MAG: ABC transporter ATP-binding protein [Clostridia bacterium]|nr:ABC transporter ATP-binding protein [Clostridia bacterium]MBR2893958.1 ABC transporter ATP-binding protein [Clostridia bacterium]
MSAIIKAQGLRKSYGKKVVLDDVSFEIEEGSIVGLLGPNGCGKTTLIKILTGLIKDHTGMIKIANEEPGAYTKSIVAFLPDKSYLPDWMKPTDAIRYFADFYSDFDKEKAERMVRDFGLDPSQRLKTMSKGQQEKLNLILVMCRQAKLYILDEPLGGLDPAARSAILDLIMSNYAQNATVLLSTHLINDVERIFDRVLMISGGKVIVNSHVNEIREKGQTVEEVFKEVFSYAW